MTTLREAAQQALAFTMRDFASLRDFEAAKAVLHDNLRDALAQQDEPEQEPVATTQQPAGDTPPSDYRRGYCDGFAIGKREGCIEAEDAAKQAEPKGGGNLPPPLQAEPVAWLYEAGTERTLHWHKPPLYGTPLYTAPPQRQPLTNDRVWLEYMQLWPFRPNEEPTLAKDILRFARAIERAHGIGEAK